MAETAELERLLLEMSETIQDYLDAGNPTPEGDAIVDAALDVWEKTLDLIEEL